MPLIALGDTGGRADLEWMVGGWGNDEVIWGHVGSEVCRVEMSRI